MKDKYGYLILLFIVACILFACTSEVESEHMPGEYVIGDNECLAVPCDSGPINVYYAGEFDNARLYVLEDTETGARCYIIRGDVEIGSESVSISCIFDPLTPRG